MKKVLCVVVTILLALSTAACGSTQYETKEPKLLDQDEFYVYDQKGEVYLQTDAYSESKSFVFGSDDEVTDGKVQPQTKRGLRIGDSKSKVKELYGNVEVYVSSADGENAEWKKISDVIDQVSESEDENDFMIRRYVVSGEEKNYEQFIKYSGEKAKSSDFDIKDFMDNPAKNGYVSYVLYVSFDKSGLVNNIMAEVNK